MSTEAAVPLLREARRLAQCAFDELTNTPFRQASTGLVLTHLQEAESILQLLVALPKEPPPV